MEQSPNQNTSWRQRLRATAVGSLMLGASLGLTGDTRPSDTILYQSPENEPMAHEVISVMTANVHGWEDPDGGSNTDRFLAMTRDKLPDVLFMQEVVADNKWSQELRKMGYDIAFVSTTRHYRDREGNAVAVLGRIAQADYIDLPGRKAEPARRLQHIAVEHTSGATLEINNLHLSTSTSVARRQVKFAAARSNRPPSLVGGDTNGVDEQALASLVGAEHVGWRMKTFPRTSPTYAFDTISTHCGLILHGQNQRIDFGSDHTAHYTVVDMRGCFDNND